MDTKLLKQKILDLAIHGKLVPQDPNDEPASVLLERIRAEREQQNPQGRRRQSRNTSDNQHYTNVPFEIPESWEWVRVNDLFLLNPKNHVDDNMDVGFVPMECVKDGYSGKHFFYTKKWQEVKKGYTHFQNGDVGVAKISPCFENRKSTIFCGLPNGYGAGTTELTILRPFSVNAAYYLYVFKTAWYISEGSKNFKGNVGQQRVSKDIFSDFLIPLPPLSEQQRIVDEIERWFAVIDDLEANKQDLQAAIKQVRAKVLDLAIHGKLVPQDPNDEPATALLRRIAPNASPCDTSHYENVPQGWAVCRLEDIVKYEQPSQYIVESTSYKEEYKTPVLTAGKSFILGYTDETQGIYDKLPAIIFDDFTTDSHLVDFPFKVKSSAMKILQVNREINIKYVAYFMSITRLVGDTHKRYWISEYSKIQIPIPPLAEQQRIVAKIESIFEILNSIEDSIC